MEMELTKEFVNSCRKVGVLRDFLCQAIDQVDEKEKEIAELKEKRRWRKCSEELPEDGAEVLATDGDGIWLCYKTTMSDGSGRNEKSPAFGSVIFKLQEKNEIEFMDL